MRCHVMLHSGRSTTRCPSPTSDVCDGDFLLLPVCPACASVLNMRRRPATADEEAMVEAWEVLSS